MTESPLVTVAMPLYNAAKSLPVALGLIRNQTYRNLEIILCDNASTDETAKICAAAVRDDSRISYHRHATNLGPVANFNFGLQLKRGEFFMWAADDDEKDPQYIAEAVAALIRNPSASLACTVTVLVTHVGQRIHTPYSPGIASLDLPTRLQAFVADRQCVAFYGLFRSSILDAIGPPDPWLDNDRRFLFRAAIAGPFEVIPKPLFRFRMDNTLEDYLGMGFRMRPGATDFDLDLHRHFPRLIREAGLDEAVVRRCRETMLIPLRPYFENRVKYLIHRVLSDQASRGTKLRLMIGWARQYPPMLWTRMYWGAFRRIVLS